MAMVVFMVVVPFKGSWSSCDRVHPKGGIGGRQLQLAKNSIACGGQNRSARTALHEDRGLQAGAGRRGKVEAANAAPPLAEIDDVAHDVLVGQGAAAVLAALDRHLDD